MLGLCLHGFPTGWMESVVERAAFKTSNQQISGESWWVGKAQGRQAMDDGSWKSRLERMRGQDCRLKPWGRGEEGERLQTGHTQETWTLPEPGLGSLSLFVSKLPPVFHSPNRGPGRKEMVAKGGARRKDPAFRERTRAIYPCLPWQPRSPGSPWAPM